MTAEIVALSCIFEGDQTNSNAFCVIEEGHARLQELGDSIAGKPEKLVGLYVPLIVQPEDEPIRDYDPTMRGRVIALVRALPMPRNKTIRDYYSDDPRTLRLFRGQLVHRWPVGWPSETVFYSANGPALNRTRLCRPDASVLERSDRFAIHPIQNAAQSIDGRNRASRGAST
jgi:hypothetical protein